MVEPGLTVWPRTRGTRAAPAEVLFARLDGERRADAAEVVPTRLIVRGSGELRP